MDMLPWDADAYDAHALPHERWGLHTLHRLQLTGTETVLDFGCGTGRDAQHLLDALPEGRVVAVDGSPEMLTCLRRRLAGRLHRVDIVQADLQRPLPIGQVDAVMSVATLHWLPDHARVFANIAAVLRPGGRFAAEAGGTGNIAGILAAVSRLDPGAPHASHRRRNFADVEDTASRLADAGFTDIHVDLSAELTLVPADTFEAFLATVVLVPELAALPPSRRAAFVHDVACSLDKPLVDWVRVRLTAVRS